MQLHKLMLITGRLIPNGRLDCAMLVANECDWFDGSASDGPLLIDLVGREEDVARLDTAMRTAVQARNAYWIAAQQRPEMNMGHVS
jgi:hypothetical protein